MILRNTSCQHMIIISTFTTTTDTIACNSLGINVNFHLPNTGQSDSLDLYEISRRVFARTDTLHVRHVYQ